MISFLLIGMFSLQDIAVDGWSVKMLHPSNVSYGSFTQSLGQRIGGLLVYNVVLWINKDAINDSTG